MRLTRLAAIVVTACAVPGAALAAPTAAEKTAATLPASRSALHPLVVCLIPGNQHTTHDDTANPGFSTFLKLFENPPLLSS